MWLTPRQFQKEKKNVSSKFSGNLLKLNSNGDIQCNYPIKDFDLAIGCFKTILAYKSRLGSSCLHE